MRSFTAGLAPLGNTLAAVRFFEPSSAFLAFMQKYADARVFDVGSGVGHITAALRKIGVKTYPIDINHRESCEVEPLIADGTIFPYSLGTVVLLARPCHGPFVEDVIEQAVARRCCEVLYVGKHKNVRDDLGRFYRKFCLVKSEVGQEGEEVWSFTI